MRAIGGTALAVTAVLVVAGIPGPAVGGTLDWTLDEDTGALWREMTADELSAVGWDSANETGWLTKSYGGLDGFAAGENTTIDVAYNGTVNTLSFQYTETVYKLLAELKTIPVGAADDLPVNAGTSAWNESVHRFGGPEDWYAEYAVDASQWTASTVLEDEEVWIFPRHPNLTLAGGEDYVYAISSGCPDPPTSGGDGSDDDKSLTDQQGHNSLCVHPPNTPDPDGDGSNTVPFTVFMFAEVEFCESDRYRDSWSTVLGNHMDHIQRAHSNTPTKVQAQDTARFCTVTTDDWTWDHNRKDWVHAHGKDANGNWHPWAFNPVQSDTKAEGHGTNPKKDPDHSYLRSKITLPCWWGDECGYNVYDGKTGPHAWMRHFQKYHADEHGDVAGDTAVVYHVDKVGDADGWARHPGRAAVVGAQTPHEDAQHPRDRAQSGRGPLRGHRHRGRRLHGDGQPDRHRLQLPKRRDRMGEHLQRHEREHDRHLRRQPMLGIARDRPHRIYAIALVLALPVLAGCLGPDVPEGPEGFHAVLVETRYDASERGDSDPEDEGVDLPQGHPAAGLELALGIDPGPGYDGQTWDYDRPCPNRDSAHGPYADCSDFERQDAYVLPSPKDADNYTRVHYPLDGEGTVVFHIPAALEILVRVNDEYTEELRDKAEDPERCDDWPQATSRRVEIAGAAERNRDRPPGWVVVSGDARVTLPWFGACPSGVSS